MTAWGEEHEKDAIHVYEICKGYLVAPAGFVPYEDWSGCSPDGWVIDGGEGGIVEVKCPFSQRIYADIPEHYRAQVIGQLGITGAKWCDFVCWTPEESKVWRVDWDPKTWDRMEAALKDFWRCVKEDTEPKRAKKFQF
jgi:hypothetical protein